MPGGGRATAAAIGNGERSLDDPNWRCMTADNYSGDLRRRTACRGLSLARCSVEIAVGFGRARARAGLPPRNEVNRVQ